MKVISKHFTADNQLVLKKEEWEPLAWTAFLAIFGLAEAEQIVVSEYKIDALVKKAPKSLKQMAIENDICEECAINFDAPAPDEILDTGVV